MTTAAPARVLLVVGARPNYMKAASLLQAAPAAGLEVVLVHTGQHYDPELSQLLLDELGLPAPAHALEVGRGRSGLEQLAELLLRLPAVLEAERSQGVVVVGDVTSTLAAALVAARAGAAPLPLFHVEAGLRSGDRTMPEELNRVLTDQLADLLFCTEPSGIANLLREGRPAERVLLVGNTMIDTLLRLRPRIRAAGAPARHGVTPRGYGLVTLHRPANVDDPERLARLLGALGEVSARLPLLFPVHPRTRGRLAALTVPPGLRPIDPLGYVEFTGLMADAALVLTDSGGVQEETTALGVPCLTLRTSTERPITCDLGTNRVIGVEPERIVAAATEVLGAPQPPPDHAPARGCCGHPAHQPPGSRPVTLPPLWDGKAGDRIAHAIAGYLAGGVAEARSRAAARGAV